MLKKVINPILFLPLALIINSLEVLSNEKKGLIDRVLEEKSNKPFISYQEIEKIILNNEELKSLKNLSKTSFIQNQLGPISNLKPL